MEAKKNNFNISLPHSINGYLNDLFQQSNNLYHILITNKAFENSKNFIVVISNEGYFKKISSSFIHSLGYSVEELHSIPIKELLSVGEFISKQNVVNYYFDNTICCKNNITKKIQWRLISDVIDDAMVFVGWEIGDE